MMLKTILEMILNHPRLGPLFVAQAGELVPHLDLDFEELQPVAQAHYLNQHDYQFSVWAHMSSMRSAEKIADELDHLLLSLNPDACPIFLYFDVRDRHSSAESGYWRVKTRYRALTFKADTSMARV